MPQPQVASCKTKEEITISQHNQALAIKSIPAYASRALNFWVCCPSRATHVDTGLECNYETWHDRGWCRMEEGALTLSRWHEARPILVSQDLGSPPRCTSLDFIDRFW